MKHVGLRGSPQDIASQEQIGGGGAGPSGAETITIDNAAAQTVALTAEKQHKTVRALQPGHTLTMPDATGIAHGAAALLLHFPRFGCRITDFAGKVLLNESPRSVVVCSLGPAGWSLSIAMADSSTVAAGEPTVFDASSVSGNSLAVASIDDSRALICWPYSSGTRCRIVKLMPDGSVVMGAVFSTGHWGNGGSSCAVLSATKAVLMLTRYGTNKGVYHVLTLDDTTITAASTEVEIVSDQTLRHRMHAVDASTFLLVWRNTAGAVNTTLAQCFSVTGTVVTAIGAPVTLQTGNIGIDFSIANMSVGKYAVALMSGNHSGQIVLSMLSVSAGFDVTASTPISMGSGTGVMTDVRRVDDNTAVVLFKAGYTNGPFYVMLATWNGTTFAPGAQVLVDSDVSLPINMHAADVGGYVLTYGEKVTNRLVSRLVYLDRGALSIGPLTQVYALRTQAHALQQMGGSACSVVMYRSTDTPGMGLVSILRNP